MTKYLRLKIRAFALHPAVLAWSIGFVLFWAVMWVFVFGGGMLEYRGEPWYEEAVKSYVSLMFGGLGIISMGSASTGIVGNIVPASAATRFLTRFSRLSPKRLLLEDTLASLGALLYVASVIILVTLGLSRLRYGVLAAPQNLPALIGLLVLLGLFFYALARFLGYLVLAAGAPKLMKSVAGMLPLLLSFIPYALIFAGKGNLAGYVFPPIGIQALIVWSVSGRLPPATNLLNWFVRSYVKGEQTPSIDPWIALASTAVWIAVLWILTMVLYKRAKALHPAELS